jgi:hypothetical protein
VDRLLKIFRRYPVLLGLANHNGYLKKIKVQKPPSKTRFLGTPLKSAFYTSFSLGVSKLMVGAV